MNSMVRAVWAAFVLCVVCAGLASAQTAGRPDLFVVSGVSVDVSAGSAAAAREQAQARAETLAFDRLVRRLTLPEAYARLGAPRLEGVAFDRLVAGLEIEDERRAGARYIGRLRVIFSPDLVRMALRDAGYVVVETRGPPVMVAPTLPGAAPELAAQWRQAWTFGGFDKELTPIAVAGETLVGAPDWRTAEPFAAAAGAAKAVYAEARLAGGQAVVNLTEVGPQGRRDLGSFSTPAQIGDGGLAAAFRQLADLANGRIQADWKAGLAQGEARRTRVAAQALFRNAAEWRRLKAALESGGTSVISEVLIEALAREGALISFTYVGAQEQVAAALAPRGVYLEGAPGALVLRVGAPR